MPRGEKHYSSPHDSIPLPARNTLQEKHRDKYPYFPLLALGTEIRGEYA
jgi:hypothetical protein